MTGIITQVLGQRRTYGIILGEDQTEYFLCVKDLDRNVPMQPGTSVAFKWCLVPGKKRPEARDVIAA